MAGVFCLLVCHPHRGRCRFMGGQVICSVVTSYRLRLRYGRVVFPARYTGLSVVNHTQKRALCLGRRYEKMLLTHSFLFRCVSQPPPLRGTSFHRKEGEPCPCIAFPYCHFERKREIFFVCGQIRNGRASENGKHGTPYATSFAPGSRRFIWALKIP